MWSWPTGLSATFQTSRLIPKAITRWRARVWRKARAKCLSALRCGCWRRCLPRPGALRRRDDRRNKQPYPSILRSEELQPFEVGPTATYLVSIGASPELLGRSDDDALRATQEAEPVDVLVLRDLADEFGTVAAQAGHDIGHVVDR